VRSYFGTFAYATCPLVLERFLRDAQAMEIPAPFQKVPPVSDSPDGLNALVAKGSALARNGRVYLEDLDLVAREDDAVTQIAKALAGTLFTDNPQSMEQRFVLVSDEVFDFLCETAVEVVARVRLQDDTKTVAPGALWYEEAVPAESIFSGAVLVADHYRKNPEELWNNFQPSLIQVGGNSTVGRGLCRVVMA
jgi:CRISPR-associated protein Cmr4